MRHVGLETTKDGLDFGGNQQVPNPGAVKASVAVSPPVLADADFRAVAEAWPRLPAAVRAGIAAMVKATPQRQRRRGKSK
jgi:hypothetical protein